MFKTPSGTWVFYRGTNGISYKHSVDEITWGPEQQVLGTPSTEDFAVAFRAIGGSTYAALAYGDGASVRFRRGVEASAGILSFDTPSVPYYGNSPIRYLRPAVAIDPNGKTVLLAVKEDNPAQKSEFRSVVATSRANSLDSSADSWSGPWFSLGNSSSDLPSVVALQGDTNEIFALVSGRSGTIDGYRYDGTDSYEANAGGPLAWGGFSRTGIVGEVNAFLVEPKAGGADVYVGGSFLDAGGEKDADYLAKWDSTTGRWSAVAKGLTGPVNAIVRYGGMLHVGGSFSNVDGVVAKSGLVRLSDTGLWEALGSGVAGGGVNALEVYGSYLIAGGSFTSAGGVAYTGAIAGWYGPGSSWVTMHGGLNATVRALEYHPLNNKLYVGGDFTNAGGNSNLNYFSEWDGVTWRTTGGKSPDGSVYATYSDGSNILVGGSFTQVVGIASTARIAVYSPITPTWSAMPTTNVPDGIVRVIASAGGAVYVGGDFTDINGAFYTGKLAKYNGTWTAVGSLGFPGYSGGPVNALAAISGTEILIGGSFSGAQDTNSDMITKFNGSTYSPLASGFSGDLNTVGLAGSYAYFGGSFTNIDGNALGDYVARWNGVGWEAMGSGTSGQVYAVAPLVTNSTTMAHDVYVGGSFTSASGVIDTNFIARWDGTNWNALGTGMNSTVTVILPVSSNEVYAGGYFTTAGGVSANRIARWTGTTWQALGGGLSAQPDALRKVGGFLYAGGAFPGAISKWTGSSWVSVGPGLNSYVSTLAEYEFGGAARLVAGGNFTNASSNPAANYIAYFDGTNWNPIGQGFNGSVRSLVVFRNELFAVGAFTMSGSTSLPSGMAKWNGSSWVDVSGAPPGLFNKYALAADASRLWTVGSFIPTTSPSPSRWNRAAYLSSHIAVSSDNAPVLSGVYDSTNKVHLLYTNPSNNLSYKQFNSGQWSSATHFPSIPSISDDPVMCYDKTQQMLRFFSHNGTAVYTGTMNSPFSGSWTTPTLFLTSGSGVQNLACAEVYDAGNTNNSLFIEDLSKSLSLQPYYIAPTPTATATTTPSWTPTVPPTTTPTATSVPTIGVIAPPLLLPTTPLVLPTSVPISTVIAPTVPIFTPTPIALPTTTVRVGILKLNVINKLTGDLFPAPSSGRMELQCTSTKGTEITSISLLPGQSGSEIILNEGEYDCKVVVSGYTSSTARVKVVAFSTVSSQVQVLARSVPVRVRAINQVSSKQITDADFYISIWSKSTSLTDYVSGITSKGELGVELVPGVVYQASISSISNVAPTMSSSNGLYLLPGEPVEFKLENDVSAVIDFELFLSNSKVVAAVKTETGVSVPARIEAYSMFKPTSRVSAETARKGIVRSWVGFDEDHLVEQFVNAGEEASLPLLPNRSYVIRAFPLASDGNQLPSSSTSVTLGENEIRPLSLTLPVGKHSLSIIPSVSGDLPLTNVRCFAYNSRGQSVSGVLSAGTTIILTLEVKENGEEWRAGCSGVSVEDEPYFFEGEVKYKAFGRRGEAVPILRRTRRFYTPQTYQFVSQLPVSIRLPDGSSSLEVPPLAFPENSLVSVRVQSASNVAIGESERPLAAFQFDLTVDGKTVTTTERPLLLSIPVTQELLDRYGASIEDVYPARFDSKTNSWQRAVGFSYSEETGEISVPVSRFSVWGLLVDLGMQFARQVPYKLRAVNRHKPVNRPRKIVTLSWDMRSNAIGSGFVVEIEWTRRLNRGTGEEKGRGSRSYRGLFRVQDKQKLVLLKPGVYRYRVTVEGGSGIPSYWHKFRVS